MSIILLVSTHIAAGAIGAAGTYFFVFRVAGEKPATPHIAHHGEHREGAIMTQTEDEPGSAVPETVPKRQDVSTWLVIGCIVFSLLVAGIGVQAYYSNKEDARQRACFSGVVQQLTSVVGVRSSANSLLEDAQSSLDRAKSVKEHTLDRIIHLVYLGQQPDADPVKLRKEFVAALTDAETAKRRVDQEEADYKKVERVVGDLRDSTPLPTVNACGPVDNGIEGPIPMPAPVNPSGQSKHQKEGKK